MHGLNTYDYGARQYNSLVGRWDRMDPLCEKYYSVSPYAYCHNNPVMLTDPNGMDDYYDFQGNYLGTNQEKTDFIYVTKDFNGFLPVRAQKDSFYSIDLCSSIFVPNCRILRLW